MLVKCIVFVRELDLHSLNEEFTVFKVINTW